MKTVQKIIILFFIILFNFQFASAIKINPEGDLVFNDAVYKESLHSIQLYRDGWKLSYPIIDIKKEVALELGFDDITSDVANYYYKIVHCNFDWTASNINTGDYIDGYLPEQLTDYSMSFNTYFNYIHYKLKIPNDDFRFLISGNYALVVFEDGDEDKIVFIKRFMVSDGLVNVAANVGRPLISMYHNNSQEVNFNIETGSFEIENPYNDIKVVILQNGRWDQCINNLKPLFDKNGILEYNYQIENIFPAGNEYRWFDIKSMRDKNPYLKSKEYGNGHFNVILFPDPIKAGSRYFYQEDLNGRYFIEIQEEEDDDLKADYISVSFTLPFESPMTDGDFYLMGALSGPGYSETNRMNYNFETKSYELSMLLKQGQYNYRYEYLKQGELSGDASITEGNFYEAENDYVILVYHRGSNSRYDRFVGYQIANSLKKK